MVAELQARIAELDSVPTAGHHQGPGVPFASLKHSVEVPPFDTGGLDRPAAEPQWAQFAPRKPGAVGRMLGGSARYSREEAAAREAYEHECARHGGAESERGRQLAERRRTYDRQAAEAAKAVAEHNAGVDQLERERAGDSEVVAQFLTAMRA